MPTHHDDIELVIGDEWVIVGKLLDENGAPLDLLTPNIAIGWTLVGPDGNQLPGLAPEATLDKQSGGIVVIHVSETFTRTLTPARYMDAIRVWVSDLPVTQWTGIILADADPFYVMLPPALPPPEAQMDEPPDDGQLYVRKAGAWEPLPSGFSTKFEYTFDDTTAAPPSNSQLRFNNADPTLVTTLWLHNNDFDGIDESNLLTLVEDGFIIFVQDKDDPNKRVRFNATGPMTNLGTYCEIPVTYVTGLGTLNNNQRVIVMVYGGG
jgi:hypothetical protein